MNLQSAQNSGGPFHQQYFRYRFTCLAQLGLISHHGYSREGFKDGQAFPQQCLCLFAFYRLAELGEITLKLGLCSVCQWKVSVQFYHLKKAL